MLESEASSPTIHADDDDDEHDLTGPLDLAPDEDERPKQEPLIVYVQASLDSLTADVLADTVDETVGGSEDDASRTVLIGCNLRGVKFHGTSGASSEVRSESWTLSSEMLRVYDRVKGVPRTLLAMHISYVFLYNVSKKEYFPHFQMQNSRTLRIYSAISSDC